MKRLRKWWCEFSEDVDYTWRAWRILRRGRRPAPPKVKGKSITFQGRVLHASVEVPWPKNINEILNPDGSPKPPWREL